MEKNILLVLLVLFLVILVSGCFEYRHDRDHRQRHEGEHSEDPSMQIDIR